VMDERLLESGHVMHGGLTEKSSCDVCSTLANCLYAVQMKRSEHLVLV